MGIVTKRGDQGKTSLFLGGAVAKNNPRVEMDGTLDELCSFVGMSKSLIKENSVKECLESIQKDFFVIGAEVATETRYLKRLVKRIDQSDVSRLEKVIKELESKRTLRDCVFCLPGKSFLSSTLDVSRTIARRAERQTVSLMNKKLLKNRYILMYLNRLSDLLYLFARATEEA